MTWISLDPEICGRMCLVLLHSVWQAALLVVLVWGVSRVGRHSVERQYAINAIVLFSVILALPVTYLTLDMIAQSHETTRVMSQTVATAETASVFKETDPLNTLPVGKQMSQIHAMASNGDDEIGTSDADIEVPVSQDFEKLSASWLSWSPWLLVSYLTGVVLLLIRLVVSVIRTNRLAAGAQSVKDERLLKVLKLLAKRWSLRVTAPSLAYTDRIVIPTVIGLLKPTILLPASAISGLSAQELELILAHELAHVRRYDMWINLVQRLAEAVLFFNPVVWYLSRRLSALREYCCDDLACRLQSAASPKSRLQYASALLHIVELTQRSGAEKQQVASLAASGRSPSELRRRVARLFGQPVREPWRLSRSGALSLALCAIGLSIGLPVWNSHAEPPVQALSNHKFQFRLKVVGPDKKLIPHAKVDIHSDATIEAEHISRGDFTRNHDHHTQAACDGVGQLEVALTDRPQWLSFSIVQPGYGPYRASWNSSRHAESIPAEFTAQLDAAWSMGGVVVDDAGRPITEVEVRPNISYKMRPGSNRRSGVAVSIETDSKGRWRFDSVPTSKKEVYLSFNHPNFQPLRNKFRRGYFEVKLDDEPSAHIELQQGLRVTGLITDDLGQPIKGAVVTTKTLHEIRRATTNDEGVYRLVGCGPDMARIVVSAKRKALDMQVVRIAPKMQPVNFTMKPGGKIRVRIVDEEDKGIPQARIFFQHWRGPVDHFEFEHVNQYTDKNGVWEWNEAPLDSFQADICRPDGMQLIHESLRAREEEYVFTPPQALVVSGRVIDANTKKPVAMFRVTPGYRDSNTGLRAIWNSEDAYEPNSDQFRIRFRRTFPVHIVRIEANGYKSAVSRDIKPDEGAVNVDFELLPAEDLVATIVSAEGKPAAKAKIAVGTSGTQIFLSNGDINDSSTYATKLQADAEGRFRTQYPDEPFQIVITHPTGFAHLKSGEGPIPGKIKLERWARAEGTFRVGKTPAANVLMSVNRPGLTSHEQNGPNIFTNDEVTTSKDGRFLFERLLPGEVRLGRHITLHVDKGTSEAVSSILAPIKLLAGETSRIELGASGRPVVGQLVLLPGRREKALWNFAVIHIRPDLTPPPSPKPPADVLNDPDKRRAWWEEWKATDVGLAWTLATQNVAQLMAETPYFMATVAPDGSFRIDDMPAGNYVLRVQFFQRKHAGGALSPIRFAVPPDEKVKDTGVLDLGTLRLK